MQSRLFIIILVLQSKRLMRVLVNPPVLFQTAPGGVFAVPQEITMDVGHLFRDADLVGVEIGEVLFAVFGVVKDLRCLGRCRYRCSCLCRCTPAIGGCRPRRSGCVSVRCSSRQVCLGVLWKAFCRTGRRRRSKSRYCRRAF